MPRLFSGLELPDEVRQQLAGLAIAMPGAKWVEAENLHMTLRFCGDVDKRKAAGFIDELDHIRVPVFSLRISGLGAFGGTDPHTIWAAVDAGPELDQLAKAHERAARAAGLPPETRKFKPHVTLARMRGARADQVARILDRHAAFRSDDILIEQFVLFSSRPSVGGGPYAIEEVFPLEGSSAGFFESAGKSW